MTAEQIAALGPAFTTYCDSYSRCFPRRETRRHLATYCRGLMCDLPRKSVEPIALAGGVAVRTLQEFLTHHVWDHERMRDQLQRRIVRDHLPAPGCPPLVQGRPRGVDSLGVIGLIDETSTPKKGDKTPGVQKQYCGHLGKVENCIVTVHLACLYGDFKTLIDSDLFLPEESWDGNRARCRDAYVPDDVVYRSKSDIALEQFHRARGNGIQFDWLTFDEWYGSKPQFLAELEKAGQLYVAEVPKSTFCWPTLPKYRSKQKPFAAKRADNVVRYSPIFTRKKWKKIKIARKTLPSQCWLVKAAQVHLSRHGKPTDRTHWLIVAKNQNTGEVKYFISNAPPRTALKTLLRVAFTRANVEHVFRVAKSEIGFSHFEGRSYRGLMRHMILCQIVMTFIAEQTERLRGGKRGDHARTSRPRTEHRLSPMAPPRLSALAS
jgi:SRSO17 transposase